MFLVISENLGLQIIEWQAPFTSLQPLMELDFAKPSVLGVSFAGDADCYCSELPSKVSSLDAALVPYF